MKHSVAFVISRVATLVFLGIFILAGTAVVLLQSTFFNAGATRLEASQGGVTLAENQPGGPPAFLEGEWEYYPSVLEVAGRFNQTLLAGKQPELVQFPLRSIEQATGPGTYRLQVWLEEALPNAAFLLPNYGEDFAIYVDGARVLPVWGGPQEKLLYSLSDYVFRLETPLEPGPHEILISANSSAGQSLLYQNEVLFGPADGVVDYVAQVWRDDTFLIGIILVLVMIGLVFMLIHTKFDMLSSIALFDTVLAVRILLGYTIATYFIHRILPGLGLSRVDFVGLQYLAFFAAGCFGCLLSQSIFDAEKKLPGWPIRVQIGMCVAGGVLTLFFYRSIPEICIGMLFLTLVGSFLIVTWHIVCLVREKRFNMYYLFQTGKTYYIGVIMALDILNLWGGSYNSLVYAYVVFLFAHMLARLMDSNASYQQAERLNHNLEQMIDARTAELTRANERLSEMTVRDPLTQAHNRLYFEEALEQVLREKPEGPLYLCMFDMDYFKSINDNYGHGAGDEQLQYVVQLVNQTVDGRATLSRVGGEEFVILFAGEEKESVLAMVEEVRRQLEREARQNEQRTTASFGLVQYQEGDSPKDFLRAADKCLYSAKKLGRNCIVTA